MCAQPEITIPNSPARNRASRRERCAIEHPGSRPTTTASGLRDHAAMALHVQYPVNVSRAFALIGLAVAALLSTPRLAVACDCHDGGPVCEAFWKTPVVFVGRVDAIEALRAADDAPRRQRVRFSVIEAFRGTTAKSVDIMNYATSCHHGFAPGERWVVYALPHERGGGLTTHTCTRTAPLEAAAEDVAYGRSSLTRVASGGKGRIFGTTSYSTTNGSVAVSGARITLQGETGPPLSAVTDSRGRYDILAPAGRFRLTARLPPRMTMAGGDRVVELSDGRGCARADVGVDYPGGIAGRVVDEIGRPIANLTVELASADAWDFPPFRLRAVTDSAGRYAITGVEPGRYAPAVVIGRTDTGNGPEPLYLFSGGSTTKTSARPITVRGGVQRNAEDLVVSRTTPVVQVTGTVVQADGRAAPGVPVRIKAQASDLFPWTTIRTDPRGGFSFALVSSLSYRLVAEREGSAGQGASLILEPSRVPSPLRLILPGTTR